SSTPVIPRVGQINFSNSLPFNLPLHRGMVDIEATFIDGDPQFLNRELEQGNLEVSSVSSYFYVQHPDHVLLPDLSISSRGADPSVLFFHKKPLAELGGAPIAVPRASATSIRLLAILLKTEANIEADFHVVEEPDLDSEAFDGVLIIGDEALWVDSDWQTRSLRIDLGKWWESRFGLPMVFGIWIARPDFVEQFPERFRNICDALVEAKRIGTTELFSQVIEEAATTTGLPQQRMAKYFKDELDFDLSSKHRESMQLYKQLCHKYRLV
ncbi:MAG: menaquinone biosynthesis protein, partial [Cyanobacteria bacterium]|nr:menaquinone biosynthesis protein [Cyanobacteriota bacterium]